MSLFTEFPEMTRAELRDFKKAIDGSFKDFIHAYGEGIEDFFKPLLYFLKWFENLLVGTPWPIMLAVIGLLVWAGSRSWTLAIGTIVSMLLIGYLGMWENMMFTLALTTVATLICIIFGIPIGVLMAKSNRMQAVITPILDIMQTIPAFVYLIPIVMILGIGLVPGLIAVIIYSIPPIVRLTNLGIRLVDTDILEAADAFGASSGQKLMTVQMPLALPNIFAGVNQTIMMALAMVVVASLLGVHGLGLEVLKAVNNQRIASGFMNGLAIVAIAIVFDRTSQKFGKRLQKHSEVVHG